MIETNIISKHIPQETKNVVLTKRFKKAIYGLATRTTAQMVYMDDTYKYTLTEMISDIIKAMATSSQEFSITSEKLNNILKDAPEEMQTFKDVWNYINIEGDSPLATAIKDRYTNGEIDDLLAEINIQIEDIKNTPNAYITEDSTTNVKNGDIYYHIVDNEIDGINDPVYIEPDGN